MGVDQQTLALNMAIILGGVILLGVAVILVIAIWTGINVAIWMIQRRRAEREFRIKHRRADGKPFPTFIEGVCSRCARGHRRVYFTASGEELCAPCYERFWRTEETHNEPAHAAV